MSMAMGGSGVAAADGSAGRMSEAQRAENAAAPRIPNFVLPAHRATVPVRIEHDWASPIGPSVLVSAALQCSAPPLLTQQGLRHRVVPSEGGPNLPVPRSTRQGLIAAAVGAPSAGLGIAQTYPDRHGRNTVMAQLRVRLFEHLCSAWEARPSFHPHQDGGRSNRASRTTVRRCRRGCSTNTVSSVIGNTVTVIGGHSSPCCC